MKTEFNVELARSLDDIAIIRSLFVEYANTLGIDLSFQKFDSELDQLPGDYSPPGGELLLAKNKSGVGKGCVAVRKFNSQTCEMKRLYVSPDARGKGLGAALIRKAINNARTMGYKRIYLDTLPRMKNASALYKEIGFEEISPYYDTPIVGTVFMSREL
ncbi:MAG: GNAT family N-acetyltransferase [Pseudomonadota bacterium]